MQIELACRYYAKGWLSLGQAARMAKLDRYAFGVAAIPTDLALALDMGEGEALDLALETKASLVLLDESAAAAANGWAGEWGGAAGAFLTTLPSTGTTGSGAGSRVCTQPTSTSLSGLESTCLSKRRKVRSGGTSYSRGRPGRGRQRR